MARPIPLEAPVTIADLPAKSPNAATDHLEGHAAKRTKRPVFSGISTWMQTSTLEGEVGELFVLSPEK
jgi:hypothetical protein